MRLHELQPAVRATLRAPGRLLAVVVLLPILVAIAVSSLQGFGAPLGDDWIFFSHFDKISLWAGNPDHHNSALLTNTAAADGLRFRPFAYAHMWLERQVWPDFAFNRWVGVLYLGLTGSALGLLLLAIKAPFGRALAAALVLIAHPAQSEVYGWASARIDTMAACYGLFGLWLVVRGNLVLSTIAFLLAFTSKESAYPLVLVAAAFGFLADMGWRSAVARAMPAVIALGLTAALKLGLTGTLIAESWKAGVVEVPLLERITGYLSLLNPLLLQPTSSESHSRMAAFFGLTFTALIVLSLLLPLLGSSVHRRSFNDPAERARRESGSTLFLGIGLVMTVLVTFGVPANANFDGGRVWFLPCAFLFGLIACSGRPLPLWIALVPGLVLLHGNLEPYREADRRMQIVLDRVHVEVAKPDTAVRCIGLESKRGPVPLFFLMTNLFHETLPEEKLRPRKPGKYSAVFLTRDDQRDIDDAPWREDMRRQGYRIADFGWDPRNGQIHQLPAK